MKALGGARRETKKMRCCRGALLKEIEHFQSWNYLIFWIWLNLSLFYSSLWSASFNIDSTGKFNNLSIVSFLLNSSLSLVSGKQLIPSQFRKRIDLQILIVVLKQLRAFISLQSWLCHLSFEFETRIMLRRKILNRLIFTFNTRQLTNLTLFRSNE